MSRLQTGTKWTGAIGAAGLIATLGCGSAQAGAGEAFLSPEAQQGYSLGHAIGMQVGSNLEGVDVSALGQGFLDAVESRDTAMSPDAMARAITDFETRQAEAARATVEAMAAANAQVGEAFRTEFAKRDGVVSLDSGLLYKVIEPGSGAPPEAGESVTVHYRGSLVDGTPLDDSYTRGEPLTIPIDRALPGWAAALERMPAGARWQVVIPPALAYGETGAMGFVEPNTTLVFELERVAS